MPEENSGRSDLITVARELLRAAVFEGRPPGTTGRVLEFTGSDEDGRRVGLTNDGEAWELRVAQGEPVSVGLEEVLRRLGKGSLRLEGMTVVPDIADYLFKHAVAQAEESLGKYLEAEKELAQMAEAAGDKGKEAVHFTLYAGALDRCVARAVTSTVLAIAAAEAQLNKWAEQQGGWRKQGKKDEDRLPAHEKCHALANRREATIGFEDPPWSDLRRAVTGRNLIVHSKPVSEVVSLSGQAHRVPGYDQSLEARRTCWAVRMSLVALAGILELELPEYLAYCPPGPPEDDEAWRNASMMTGTRPDPDFPTVSERLRDSNRIEGEQIPDS